MRGKLFNLLSIIRKNRITPADAGKTTRHRRSHRRSRDHPRGCGENLSLSIVRRRKQGSPPRMRGKLKFQILSYFCHRITPADAGKTARDCGRAADTEDHPRGCGENCARRCGRCSCNGSPPRMRGKPRHNVGIYVGQGITPADAGKTYPQS